MKPVEPREHLEGAGTAFIGPTGSGIEPLPAIAVRTDAGLEVRTECGT